MTKGRDQGGLARQGPEDLPTGRLTDGLGRPSRRAPGAAPPLESTGDAEVERGETRVEGKAYTAPTHVARPPVPVRDDRTLALTRLITDSPVTGIPDT